MSKKNAFIILIFLILASIIVYIGLKKEPIGTGIKNYKNDESLTESLDLKRSMKFISPAFENKSFIPSKYACDGINISPPFEISSVPDEAQSLVLIVSDPDAPTGIWTHWLVWNIGTGVKNVSEGSVPDAGVEGTNDFGTMFYKGPCPPYGTHNYEFKLYALDTRLNLKTSTKRKELEDSMKGHILSQEVLVGLYKR